MKNQNINTQQDYKYGNTTEIESVRSTERFERRNPLKFISQMKKEPQWMLDWRLKALNRLKKFKRTKLAKTKISKNKLPGSILLFCT